MEASGPVGTKHPAPRRARIALIAAALVGLAVAAVGLGFTLTQKPVYSASESVAIVPKPGIDVNLAASLFDSLSRGQVAATAAEVYSQDRWHPDTPDVEVNAGVVTPSSVLHVTARGENADQVEAALQKTLTRATPQVDKLLAPYQAISAETSVGAAVESGISKGLLAAISLGAAVVAGFTVLAALRAWLP